MRSHQCTHSPHHRSITRPIQYALIVRRYAPQSPRNIPPNIERRGILKRVTHRAYGPYALCVLKHRSVEVAGQYGFALTDLDDGSFDNTCRVCITLEPDNCTELTSQRTDRPLLTLSLSFSTQPSTTSRTSGIYNITHKRRFDQDEAQSRGPGKAKIFLRRCSRFMPSVSSKLRSWRNS